MSEAVRCRVVGLVMIATIAVPIARAGAAQDAPSEVSASFERTQDALTHSQRAAGRNHHHRHRNRAKASIQHHANEDMIAEDAGARGSVGHQHKRGSHRGRGQDGSLVRRSVDAAPEDHLLLESPAPAHTAASTTTAEEEADARANFDATGRMSFESFDSLSTCARLMVGTWWLHGGSDFREFRIFRDFDGSVHFRQVWGTFPYKRLGRLEQMRSEISRPTRSGHVSTACVFQGNLTDGDQIHIYYHFANSRIPETMEVAAAHNLLQPVLASRRPPPWMSPSSSAIIVAVVLMLTSVLATCWRGCGPVTTHPTSKKSGTRNQQTRRAAEGHGSFQPSAGVTQNASSAMQETGKQPERVREEWLDSLRLTCIIFMVVRHALQSLERLLRLPPQLDSNVLAFFLHGLPIFLYIAGRSCGTSMPPQGTSFTDQLRYLRRRAVRLLIPDLLGAALVVMPTEYIGRDWRPCANMGNRDGFKDWLRAYLFNSGLKAGWHCEGLGWLGFLISLFCVQAMVYPWAAALHYQILLRADQAKTTWASLIRRMCFPMLWQLWLAVWLSCMAAVIDLDSNSMPLRGILRPDVALVCAPLLADMVMVQLAPAGASRSASWRYYFWLAAVLRRVVASVAMATFTLRIPFDKSQMHTNNASTLWVELLCFAIFYQQGVLDGVLKTAAAREQAEGEEARDEQSGEDSRPAEQKLALGQGVFPFLAPVVKLSEVEMMLPKTLMQKMRSWNPQKNCLLMAGVCWGLWLLLAMLPVPGMFVYGAGFRYPAYRRGSAGHFILRSWAILGIAIWWWTQHLPEVFKRMSGFAELGFSFYFLHWFFIEAAMLKIYGRPVWPLPGGDVPWWAGLFLSLLACCLGVLLCHALLVLLVTFVRGGLRCYQSRDEFVIAFRTNT